MGLLKRLARKKPEDGPCPCSSGRDYAACCGPFLGGDAVPESAEELMRSRFTAHVRGDRDWLRATWHPATRPAAIDLGGRVRWIRLEILAIEAGGPGDTKGTVEFVAHCKIGGRAHRLHERSRFQRRDGRWLYVNGDVDPPPGGDDPSAASG